MIFDRLGGVQKALHLHEEMDKANPKCLGKEYAVMEKLDGWYVYIDCLDGEWQEFRSRVGRVIPSLMEYTKAFKTSVRPTPKDIRLIFEATIDGMIFKDLNGKLNQKAALPFGTVALNLHDVLIANVNYAFRNRYGLAQQFFGTLKGLPVADVVRMVPILQVTAEQEAWRHHYEQIISKPNGEGIILKAYDAPYAYGKRNASLMKIKCELTLDLEVIGMAHGERGTKYESTLGYLIVREKSGKTHTVSGMTDQQRHMWMNNPSLIIGAVVEIQAMKRLPNGSLREGRFKAIRHDKNVSEID